eukprot:CAMPEP_0204604072 /NCGR_PEP_ID=MMETSP0661-20131031/57638_1 /ASSEMBLY_ACC=CAM_ASM_000606 /TAXON_ID=109239 /ORGANISM="Alexandrium margalefi, Strain AMGDE01CS-322" /LENGTH=251 /DNA_ID=CAMNT_0051615197 /DNA_START=107 /DNA_END=859 /DNA_ORIENTATION=-
MQSEGRGEAVPRVHVVDHPAAVVENVAGKPGWSVPRCALGAVGVLVLVGIRAGDMPARRQDQRAGVVKVLKPGCDGCVWRRSPLGWHFERRLLGEPCARPRHPTLPPLTGDKEEAPVVVEMVRGVRVASGSHAPRPNSVVLGVVAGRGVLCAEPRPLERCCGARTSAPGGQCLSLETPRAEGGAVDTPLRARSMATAIFGESKWYSLSILSFIQAWFLEDSMDPCPEDRRALRGCSMGGGAGGALRVLERP